VTSLDLALLANGWGCFVPDLTRLAAPPCREARQKTVRLLCCGPGSRPEQE
jgi:hypothetical protein